MFRTRAAAVLLTAVGIVGVTPLAAHASIVRVSGPVITFDDRSTVKIPAGTIAFTANPAEQWTGGMASKVDDVTAAGMHYRAGEATYLAAPATLTAFYNTACANVSPFVATTIVKPLTSSKKVIGKSTGQICSFSTSTGELDVLFVFNGPQLVILSAQQIGPNVSQAPLFSTYIKTLKLAKLPKPPRAPR
jgi:hypothetical protein